MGAIARFFRFSIREIMCVTAFVAITAAAVVNTIPDRNEDVASILYESACAVIAVAATVSAMCSQSQSQRRTLGTFVLTAILLRFMGPYRPLLSLYALVAGPNGWLANFDTALPIIAG